MNVSKSATVTVSNARISFEALVAFLRVIEKIFLSVLPQDGKGEIMWDIKFRTAQGEMLSLSSGLLEGEVAEWIRERVILTVWTEITFRAGECWRKVDCRFVVGHIPHIQIHGDSDFVDLMHKRLVEWNDNLPHGRFPFFKLLALIIAICAGIFTFVVLIEFFILILKYFEVTALKMTVAGAIAPFFVLVVSACAGVFVATVVMVLILLMWPYVDLNIGIPTQGQIVRGKIMKGAKWVGGLIAVCGGAVGIYAFFLGG